MLQRLVKVVFWFMLRLIYRVRVRGLDNIPRGPALLTPNHVSYIDALLICAHIGRKLHFPMYYTIYNRLKWVVAPMGGFPICAPRENIEIYKAAFVRMTDALRAGDLVCIFPEGMLTRNGELNEFKRGYQWVLNDIDVPVVPIALRNLWGSYFSRKKKGLFKLPDHFMAKIEMVVGQPIYHQIKPAELREEVARLL